MRVSVWKTGLVIGLGLGLWHLCWAVLVALGAAEAVTDFVLQSHSLARDARIERFDATVAAILVGVTTVLGSIIGSISAISWNALHRGLIRAYG